MFFMKMLAVYVAGALLCSTGAFGRPTLPKRPPPKPTNGSSASCTVIAIAFSDAENTELRLSAGALSYQVSRMQGFFHESNASSSVQVAALIVPAALS
jgi:hypothetical protein